MYNYSSAGQKITSLLSKDMLFYLCLTGSDFVSADELYYLGDNERASVMQQIGLIKTTFPPGFNLSCVLHLVDRKTFWCICIIENLVEWVSRVCVCVAWVWVFLTFPCHCCTVVLGFI